MSWFDTLELVYFRLGSYDNFL